MMKLLLAAIGGIAAWIVFAVYLAFSGAWMTGVAAQGDIDEFYEWSVAEIEAKNPGSSALVLLEDGAVAKQYFASSPERIDEDTLFPTASFSKWVAALSVMSLVESDKLDLDLPVSRYLTRWQLPDTEFDNDDVTIRRLLSHTAGLTDRLGFGDYGAEEVVPAVEHELRNPRASSGNEVEVAVGIEPGTDFLYSGGGYLILQLVVEEVTGVAFADYVRSAVLEPAGMSRSSFAFLGKLENVSPSYDVDGSIAQTYQYASPAATGFASSAGDLAKLARLILAANDDVPLKSTTIAAMRKPHGFVMGAGIWGLGTVLYAPSSSDDYVFGHDGVNDPAINSTVRLNPETADGIVVLVSGHPTLASNIGSEWVLWQTGNPDFLQTERALRSALVPILGGSLLVIFGVFLFSRRLFSRRRKPVE